MTDIRNRVGAKWFAGLMLASLVLSMGNGLALSARAQEVPQDPPTETATTTEETPSTPEETTPAEETPALAATTVEEENNAPTAPPGEDGENGADGNATSTSDGTPSEITTGNAEAGAGAGAVVNVTDVDTNASSTPPTNTQTPPATTTPTTGTSTPPASSTETTVASSTSSTPSSTPENPGSNATKVDITHDLVASTTIHAEGNTGENELTDPDHGTIETGDGDVWAQDNFFFNIALVDSSLGILVLRNPTETELDFRNRLVDFFTLAGDGQADAPEGCIPFYNCKKAEPVTATSTNQALLERNMAALCNSGANYGGLISTGDCTASGVMSTMGNWFAFNSNLMVLLVNQVGDMNADVVLPEPSFFEQMRKGTITNGTHLAVEQNASTTITGESVANSGVNSGDQGVATGEADADAATVNMINQVNPLTCFIVAVGGTWNGEVYQLPEGFQSQATPFGSVICGRGGAEGNVEAIDAVVKNDLTMVVDALVGANTGTNIGEGVATGNAKSFLTILNVVNSIFVNQDWMLGLFTVSGDWNGDLTFGARPGASPEEQAASELVSGKSTKKKYLDADVSLTKTSSVTTAGTSSVVDYTIKLVNNGRDIARAVLEDTLKNPFGTVVSTQKWDLGTVLAGEEIVIEYSVEYNGGLIPGDYTNSVKLTGRGTGSRAGESIKPVYASVTVKLVEGEVLGATECPAYLTSYIVPGADNDEEQVRLLEVFLKDGRGEDITPDGIYDALSIEAVKRFQSEYAGSILAPWGIGEPTGHVYFTTRKKINELYCNDEKDFPLSSFEVQEIELYRNGVLQDPATPVGLLPTLNPWSAADFPLISEFNLLSPLSAPATPEPTLAWYSPLTAHPLFSLLFDIFSQIASGFSVERAQASH